MGKNLSPFASVRAIYMVIGVGIISAIFIAQTMSYINGLANSEIVLTSTFLGEEGQRQAIFTFAVISIGLILALIGIRSVIKSYTGQVIKYLDPISGYEKSRFKFSNSNKLSNKKLFWISTISYLVIILFTSNVLIYRTAPFTQVYGVPVPSVYVIPCCGFPGTYPVLALYLTDHVGLLITPLGLILCTFITVLVGLNLKLISLRLRLNRQIDSQNTKRLGIITLIGSSTGLVSSCPSCAGTVLISFFGMGAGILNYFNNGGQMVFIFVTGLCLLYSTTSLVRGVTRKSCAISADRTLQF
ncbi:MAG: hypothetical protein ACM3JQ_01335 [Candidatus Eiseniibacteriota bacterium]